MAKVKPTMTQAATHPTVRADNSPIAGRPVGDWSGYVKG